MQPSFFSVYFRKPLMVRGCIVSVIVGSLLTLINQGPMIAEGQMPALWQIILTYTVPFLVSTISAAFALVKSN